jgi:hypothetical protein
MDAPAGLRKRRISAAHHDPMETLHEHLGRHSVRARLTYMMVCSPTNVISPCSSNSSSISSSPSINSSASSSPYQTHSPSNDASSCALTNLSLNAAHVPQPPQPSQPSLTMCEEDDARWDEWDLLHTQVFAGLHGAFLEDLAQEWRNGTICDRPVLKQLFWAICRVQFLEQQIPHAQRPAVAWERLVEPYEPMLTESIRQSAQCAWEEADMYFQPLGEQSLWLRNYFQNHLLTPVLPTSPRMMDDRHPEDDNCEDEDEI